MQSHIDLITLAVSDRADVDALLARAEDAGSTLTDRPHDRPWGIYAGYFRDLDGHLWEVIWNPRLARPGRGVGNAREAGQQSGTPTRLSTRPLSLDPPFYPSVAVE